MQLAATIATAGGTIALAALTAWYAYLTNRLSNRAAQSAKSAERSARAAEHAVYLARLQVMLEQMPKLTLRVTARAGFVGGPLDQLVAEGGNEGRSRAVAVALRVDGGLANEFRPRLARWEQVPPGGQASTSYKSNETPANAVLEALNDERRVELLATFQDDLGNRYRTRHQLIPRRRRSGQPVARSQPSGFDFWDGDRWQPLGWESRDDT
jgi:hypothetical protein